MSNLQQQIEDVPGNCESRLSLEDAGDDSVTGEGVKKSSTSNPDLSSVPSPTHKDRDEDLRYSWWKTIRNCLCPWAVRREKSHPKKLFSCWKFRDERPDKYGRIPCSVPLETSLPVYIPPAQPVVPNPQIPPQIPPQE
ncbi:hypothetical protein J6590_031185 [Homalodisca vitripennis]|nr:hypothetical protein J6590_031185 [Homalodisca vitripennis]